MNSGASTMNAGLKTKTHFGVWTQFPTDRDWGSFYQMNLFKSHLELQRYLTVTFIDSKFS